MAEVSWTAGALRDLKAITRYVSLFNPLAAQRMASRIRTAASDLQDMPERGRAIGIRRRELTSVPPYLIRYRLRDGVVEITTIRHGARRPLR